MTHKTIESQHLRLISCNKEILEKAIQGNHELANILNIHVPDNWTEFGTAPLTYFLDKIALDEEIIGWASYFPVLKAENKLIGSCGYKGKPDDQGVVEIGYEIAPEYRNKGFATELSKALISNAFADHSVRMIIAHTLPFTNASTRVLGKLGFTKTSEINDPEDGVIWRWELGRER